MVKFLGFLLKWGLVTAVFALVAISLVIFYYYRDLPTLAEMENANKEKQVIEILYSNKNKIATLGDLYSNQAIFSEIPSYLIDAVIATEDRKFFQHMGFDVFSIARAFYVNYRADKIVQGGSTITQQLAKLLFLNPEKTFKRKIQEIILAWQLEKTFSKEQILTIYLNRAYFGSGNYGVVNASQYYFGKPVAKLNLNESAMLAGILKAPSKLSPTNNKKLSQERTIQVLKNMIDAGYLNEDNLQETKTSLSIKEEKMQQLYFSDYVSSQITDYLPQEQQLKKNRLIITTTMDEKLQKIVEEQTNDFVKKNDKKIGQSQIAVVLMNKDGSILAMIGGKNYQTSPFNRAVYAKRQAGSVFKIFVYITALQNGFKPNDTLEDKPVTLGGWSPENYEKKYYGKVSLSQAFAKSLNSVAVQLIEKLDKKEIINNALKMGIISTIDNQDSTLALGTTEVSLLELVNSYTTIANGGLAVLPYSIKMIKNNDGEILYQNQQDIPYQIITNDNIADMKIMLKEVVKNGTGKAANFNDKIYGKTGTSQNYRDSWFIGFDNQYILGIWIGNDDNKPTNKITGGDLPAQLFSKILKSL